MTYFGYFTTAKEMKPKPSQIYKHSEGTNEKGKSKSCLWPVCDLRVASEKARLTPTCCVDRATRGTQRCWNTSWHGLRPAPGDTESAVWICPCFLHGKGKALHSLGDLTGPRVSQPSASQETVLITLPWNSYNTEIIGKTIDQVRQDKGWHSSNEREGGYSY